MLGFSNLVNAKEVCQTITIWTIFDLKLSCRSHPKFSWVHECYTSNHDLFPHAIFTAETWIKSCFDPVNALVWPYRVSRAVWMWPAEFSTCNTSDEGTWNICRHINSLLTTKLHIPALNDPDLALFAFLSQIFGELLLFFLNPSRFTYEYRWINEGDLVLLGHYFSPAFVTHGPLGQRGQAEEGKYSC